MARRLLISLWLHRWIFLDITRMLWRLIWLDRRPLWECRCRLRMFLICLPCVMILRTGSKVMGELLFCNLRDRLTRLCRSWELVLMRVLMWMFTRNCLWLLISGGWSWRRRVTLLMEFFPSNCTCLRCVLVWDLICLVCWCRILLLFSCRLLMGGLLIVSRPDSRLTKGAPFFWNRWKLLRLVRTMMYGLNCRSRFLLSMIRRRLQETWFIRRWRWR